MKVASLKTVCPLLDQNLANDLAKNISYGDMIAILNCARCGDARDFEKICFDMQKILNSDYEVTV